MTKTETLPRWQLTSIFPGLHSAEYQQAKTDIDRIIGELGGYLDENKIGSGQPLGHAADVVEVAEELIRRLNAASDKLGDVMRYLYLITSSDAFNDHAQGDLSELKPVASRYSALAKRVTAYFGRVDVDWLVAQSELLEQHAYFLRRSRIEARHMMGDEAEELVSALNQTGAAAWEKLHDDLVSRHAIKRIIEGEEDEYGLAALKNLQHHESGEVRKAAFAAEIELLERDAVAHAAAMNAIKGQVNELCRRRGYASPLGEALFDNAITETSLSAMQQACQEAFPSFRRYLKAKAQFLGKDALDWHDLFAPVSVGPPTRYRWDEVKSFIETTFDNYSSSLANFAGRAFEAGWFDVPPARGKVNGAYCMEIFGRKQSRILLNFGESLDDLFTVAHELGHAYHNDCMFRFGRTPLQSDTPMTLAETASIFCETIVVNALLDNSGEAERLAVLEQDLAGTAQLVLDIHSRFLFEDQVFARRRARELSTQELKEIMLEAQEATYGPGLRPSGRHPYMWAHKGHYYSGDSSYYNFPYTFGYLFGLGLYAEYEQRPDDFRERYDEFLATTAMADAAPLAAQFGIDIEDQAFWRRALTHAEARIEEYERLATRYAP